MQDEVLELGTVTDNVTAKTILEKKPRSYQKNPGRFLGKSKFTTLITEPGFSSTNQKGYWRSFEESGQWAENVNRTHLVFASGKRVPQKKLAELVFLSFLAFFQKHELRLAPS